jgi:putative lipase involved disintegration of autophagic bodies
MSESHYKEWDEAHGMKMPDPTDPKTVLALAQMTLNAYSEPEKKTWVDIDGWNVVSRINPLMHRALILVGKEMVFEVMYL